MIDKLDKAKHCTKGAYAAIHAPEAGGRRLTAALVNLSRHMGLTSTLWSLRQFAPIRKAGPRVVQNINNLRPISLSSDLAQVQDALWLSRNARKLEAYCGPDQIGGVSDVVSAVLALILHAQLRAYQGLSTFWALADLRWAFDVAILLGMKLGCYQAGIVSTDWLLIDDIMSMDKQCLHLHGWLSETFVLGAGTAQGRRFSIHVFNGLLKWLQQDVESTLTGGTCAWLPPFAREVLEEAAQIRPLSDLDSVPARYASLYMAARQIAAAADSDAPPWTQTKAVALQVLQRIPTLADRCQIIEILGTWKIAAIQYVDDLTAPCPSAGAVRAILRRDDGSVCDRYARKAKAEFNYGIGKTAAMALLGSPSLDPAVVGCEVVRSRKVLGVLVDDGLTFEPLLADTVRRGWSAFLELFHTAETGGFPIPVMAAQIPVRLEPELLFSAALLIAIPQAEIRLNRLQYRSPGGLGRY